MLLIVDQQLGNCELELKDKLSMLPGLAFHDALRVGLIGGEKPFVYYLLAVCVQNTFFVKHRSFQILLVGILVVEIGYAYLQSKGQVVAGIYIVQVGMFIALLLGCACSHRFMMRMAAIPFSYICQGQLVVISNGITQSHAIVVNQSKGLLRGLVIIRYSFPLTRIFIVFAILTLQ